MVVIVCNIFLYFVSLFLYFELVKFSLFFSSLCNFLFNLIFKIDFEFDIFFY